MRRIFIVTILLLAGLLSPLSTRALTLTPAILDLKIKPGTTQSFNVELANEAAETVFLRATWKKFTVAGNHGAPQIAALPANDPVAAWLSSPGQYLQLAARRKVIVPFKITVPPTASGGEYHLFLSWQSFSPARPGGSGVSVETGSLIFLQVEKNLLPQLTVNSFKLSPEKKFYFSQPTLTVLKVSNNGNITEIPQGYLTVSGWGWQNNQTVVNLAKQRILPGENRELYLPLATANNWLKHWLFGKYQVNLQLTDQEGRIWGNYPLSFYVISWFWLVLVVILLVIILGFVFRRKK